MKNLLSTMRRSTLLQAIALCLLLPSFAMLPSNLNANPQGGIVVEGIAEILQGENFDPAFLEIMQSSDKAILNWEDFSIGEGETTKFNVPGAGSATLNRVTGANLSSIYGNLISNGKVILVNQNGIMVGPGGVIDAFGGFIGSTLDIDNADFMNGGDDVFTGSTANGVTNLGTIISGGGDVILLGNFIDNRGTLGAVDGTVALGVGGDILVSQAGEARISVRGPGVGGDVGISNAGDIRGSSVELKAHGNVYAQAINNSGMIRATGATTSGGRVILSARSADGTTGGSVASTGEVRATNADGSGGFIMADAGGAGGVLNIDGALNASGIGDTPGGTVMLLGEEIGLGASADVRADGSIGGAVIIGSADETTGIRAAAGSRVSAGGSSGVGGAVIVSGTADSVIALDGTFEAKGATTGGMITVAGGDVSVGATGVLNASGAVDGGLVGIDAAATADIQGMVLADGGSGNGGFISIEGDDGVTVGPAALISASGEVDGGTVFIESSDGSVTVDGTVNANGVTGNGGVINVKGADGVSIGTSANLNANGGTDGGVISIDSVGGDTIIGGSANLSATGGSGKGGEISVSGENVTLRAGNAVFDASGGSGGGSVKIGGEFQGGKGLPEGDATVRNAQTTTVGRGVTIDVSSLNSGNAGLAVVWADKDTIFNGDVLAQGRGEIGNGGLVEISGKRNLTYRGTIDATSVNGSNGSVLFDPGDLTIGRTTGDIRTGDINSLLQTGTNVIVATDNSDGASGDILVISNGEGNDRDNSIQWNTSADFGLFAAGNVSILTNVRNAGSGSVNIIAGWDGLEGDLAGFTYLGNGGTADTRDFIGLAGVESIYDHYVTGAAAGSYGARGGSIFLNDISNNTSVIVGSRYGDTNVAGANLVMQGGNINRRTTHLGFLDWGAVFDSSATTFGLDRDLLLTGGVLGDALVAGSDSAHVTNAAGEVGVNLYYIASVATTGYSSDPSAQGGVLTDGFTPFSDHWQRIDLGNYWWRGLTDTTDGRGNALPEHGTGSAADPADINVNLTGSLVMQTDNDDSEVQIGHGGFAGHGNDTRSWGRTRNDGDQGDEGTERSINMAHDDNRYSGGIARVRPVYGDINIDAGSAGFGVVQLIGGTSRGVQIGHGGIVQVGGELHGDITVAAGADVRVSAGGGWNGHATIGHHISAGETFADSTTQRATIGWYDEGDGASFDAENVNPLRGPGLYNNFVGDIEVTSRFGGVSVFGATAGAGTGSATGNTKDAIIPFTENPDGNVNGGIGVDLDGNSFGRGGRASAQIGHGGTDVGATLRANYIGDVTVLAGVTGTDPANMTINNANADVHVEGGSRLYTFAKIGHGGYNSSREDQSDYQAGDIRVQAGGSVEVTGTTTQPTYPLTNLTTGGSRGTPFNMSLRAYAQIGHGGLEEDAMFSSGDILVTAGKDVHVTAGFYNRSFAMIGHGGDATRGQKGGTYSRVHDGATFTNTGTIGAAGLFNSGEELVLENKDGDIFGNLITTAMMSDATDLDADIYVSAGRKVILDHEKTTSERSYNNPSGTHDDPRDIDPTDGTDQLVFGRFTSGRTFSQIGHGGYDTARDDNIPNRQFSDKFGNIKVTAVDDVHLESGGGGALVSTAIGSRDVADWGRSEARGGQLFQGNITVESTAGNVILDGSGAGAFYRPDPNPTLFSDPTNVTPTNQNSIAIGHGGTWNLNWYRAVGDINVTSAQDTTVIAGAGVLGSFAQIGHGYFDPDNSDNTNGIAEKNKGDINVTVGGNLTLTANGQRPTLQNRLDIEFGFGTVFDISNPLHVAIRDSIPAVFDATNPAHVAMLRAGVSPTPILGGGADVVAAYAAIGHGGAMVEGGQIGDINVNVVGDIDMISARREERDRPTGTGPAINYGGFTQIGHLGLPSGDVTAPTTSNYTANATYNGDINIQAGGNLTQEGGTTLGSNDLASPDVRAVVLAFNHIGHGGPDVDGPKAGNIDITVGGDYTATDGQSLAHDASTNDGGNYVQVGHGDWLRVALPEAQTGFALAPGTGARTGDIYVKVGETATLDKVLVGHGDFNTQPLLTTIGQGNTYFGVSRNNPFQSTGTGSLITRNGTTFSSGFYGATSELRIYIPKRELNMMDQTTVLNTAAYGSGTPGEGGSGTGGISFFPPFPLADELSGRGDEVYLNPDLWLQASASGGVDFVPGDVAQQGSVAAVDPTGDIGNLTGVTDNAQLGTGTGTYVGGNGINGAGFYTIYYDAIGILVPSAAAAAGGGTGGSGIEIPPPVIFVPTPEEPVVIEVPFNPFNFLPFVDLFKFEQSDRGGVVGDLIEGDVTDGGGGPAGSDDNEEEEEKKKRSAYARQVDNWNVYYQYDLGTGQYNSLRLFGTPGELAE